METLKELFELLSQKKWIIKYTNINPTGGIQHRILGKSTNPNDKQPKTLKPDEIEQVKQAWQQFKSDGDKVIDAL